MFKISLCGRPNVGKSALFNRLIGKKKALVLDLPGVTRDVHRARLDLEGTTVELADLAGLEKESNDPLQALAFEAAFEYLRQSDLILFVIDGRAPITGEDEALARLIRSLGKPVQVILSKIEGNKIEEQAQVEAAALAFGEGIPTSAEHNLGINNLKEKLVELAGIVKSTPSKENLENKEAPKGSVLEKPITFGVYGRPNVGKSTLVNLLLGENRMITSPIAGTTVDTVDSDFERGGKFYRILDTAGIRRKSKTEQGVEVLSVVKALGSARDVDIALFMIDGYEGVTDQDEKVAGELLKLGRPVIIIINKWDLCRGKKDEYASRLREAMGFLDFAPLLFISAEKGEGVEPLWDLISEVISQRLATAPTGELNRFLELVEGANNPTGVKLFYASQTSKNPPTITIIVSDPKKVHFAYERYLKNELRARYGWLASPLKLVFKSRTRRQFYGSTKST